LNDDRPVQDRFQQMTFRGHNQTRFSQRRIAFGGDDQGLVGRSPDAILLHVDAADEPIVGGIQGVG
jgi:hypothetical protein